MSDSLINLRHKIASAGDLQSVVRSMKALAAASIGQYEKSVRALADYHRTVELGLGACLRLMPVDVKPMPRGKRRAATVDAVVFGSDQGLVGGFNEAISQDAVKKLAAIPGTRRIWAVGERVHGLLAEAGLPPKALFPVPNAVKAITPLVGRILVETEKQSGPTESHELHLFYNSPTTGAVCAPVSLRLLPLDDIWRRRLIDLPWPEKNRPEVLGPLPGIIGSFVREYLFVSIFRACAESLESENASRLAAMQRADKNISDLLEEFNRAFHRMRQNGIDEELFDVISGFEAQVGR